MGRPRNRKQQRRPVSRRDFLRLSGAAMLAAASVPLLQACGGRGSDSDSGSMPQPGPVSFLHGVASGDPLSNAVILWTRVTPPGNGSGAVAVDFFVATDAGMTAMVKTGRVSTDASRDYTVKIDANALQ